MAKNRSFKTAPPKVNANRIQLSAEDLAKARRTSRHHQVVASGVNQVLFGRNTNHGGTKRQQRVRDRRESQKQCLSRED